MKNRVKKHLFTYWTTTLFRDGGHAFQKDGQIALLIHYKILQFQKNPCAPTDLAVRPKSLDAYIATTKKTAYGDIRCYFILIDSNSLFFFVWKITSRSSFLWAFDIILWSLRGRNEAFKQKINKKWESHIYKLSYHLFQGWWSCFSIRWSNSSTNSLQNPAISKKSMCSNRYDKVSKIDSRSATSRLKY